MAIRRNAPIHPNASVHPNAQWFSECEAALRAGDVNTWLAIFDDDMVLHTPPALPWSPGELRGADAIVQLWATMMSWTDNRFENTVLEVIGGRNLVVTLNEVTATRRGRTKTWDTVWTYRLRGRSVVEAFLLPSLGADEVIDFWAR